MSLQITAQFIPKNAVDLFSQYVDGFEEKAKDTHNKWVLMVNEYIYKYIRVDTGRARGSWTAFMRDQGHDYSRSTSGIGDATEEEVGQSLSQFVKRDFHTELISNVDYMEVMDRRYGMFGFSPTDSIAFGGFMTEGTRQRGVRKVFAVSDLGNRVTRAPSFNDKIPYFEGMAQVVYDKFLNNAKEAYEKSSKFSPGVIEPVKVDPPLNP